ncbi:MAG: ATP-binding protein [Myxococcota bacterium]
MSISLETYAAFLETLPQAAVVVDPGARIKLINAKARALLRAPTSLEGLRLTLGKGGPACTLRRFDGTAVTLAVSLAPLDLGGQPLSLAVLSTAHDDERLRQVVRLGNIGIFDIDYTTGAMYWSPEQRALYGFDPLEPVSIEKHLAVVDPEDRPRVTQAVLRSQDPSGDGLFVTEYRFRRRDGEVRWVSSRGITFFDDSTPRRAIRSVGAELDITAQRTLEAQLRHSQKMEAVGRLAGGVAHDFNNLLTVINSNAELLLEDPLLAPALAEDVEMIRSAGQSAAGLTRQLLAFSRKQVLQPVVLELGTLVRDIEKMLRRVIGEDVSLEAHCAPGLWNTRVDRGQMEQVLVNLAVNARDAMPGGGRLTLETGNVVLDEEYAAQHAEVKPGEYAMLAVTDNGTGIPPEVLPKIFEPFFSTKGAQGTGLGLATVYGIVKQSGGHVNVYSEPGHGTTFKLYFPRELGDAPEAPPPPKSTRAAPPSNVLVVEDSEGIRALVNKLLTARGHTVLVAANSADALKLVEAHQGPLHLMITDVVLPGLSGRELATELRKTRPSLQVLFMSGYTENSIVHHGVLEPGLDFIAKPFTFEEFGRKVDELLLR